MLDGLICSVHQPASDATTLLVWRGAAGALVTAAGDLPEDQLTPAAPHSLPLERDLGLPFSDDMFARVVVAAGRCHPEDLSPLLREVERVCLPGARVVIGGSWLTPEKTVEEGDFSASFASDAQGVLAALRRGLTNSALQRARYNFLSGWVSTVWELGRTPLFAAH